MADYGDFNDTVSLEERTGSSDSMRRRCDRFKEWVEDMELLDLRFTGPKFTWSRGLDPSSRTSAHLDRGLCNMEWRGAFPEAPVKHLACNQSDHAPVLLKSNRLNSQS
ncbi:hypothetical protein V2J09_021939 [Rumex salicifolius]